MISKSKYELDEQIIKNLFAKAGISGAHNITPLGAGEFNSVYAVDADGKKYALKVAPKNEDCILTYENNMIEQEIYYYSLMKSAGIGVPEIYYSDFSNETIAAGWFIMERLDGCQLDKAKLNDSEKKKSNEMLCEMIAKMHSVKGEKFGYRQNSQFDSWYSALKNMVENLIEDGKKRGHNSKNGVKMLSYIEDNKEILEKVKCNLINFDIWSPNIFVCKATGNDFSLKWIDPERCFFGDKILDFVCVDIAKMSLDKKSKSIAIYNKYTTEPIAIGNDERVRFGFALCYLGLIMETEKYARYSPLHFGWWRNIVMSNMYFKSGFKQIKKFSKV